jgi:predicted PurR-regulated permease PerM
MAAARVTPRHPARVISDHPERPDTRLMLIAADYPFMDVFWSILVFFLWVAWLMVLFRIIGDIFRRHDISGWVKALWVVFVIVLPFLGVLVYLIAQGQQMAQRDMEQAAAARAEFDDYVRSVARTEGQQPTGTQPPA